MVNNFTIATHFLWFVHYVFSGCLAGSVYAAAVILPKDFKNELLNDSKQLTEKQRYALREVIEREAIAWAVGIVSPEEIDEINILRMLHSLLQRSQSFWNMNFFSKR